MSKTRRSLAMMLSVIMLLGLLSSGVLASQTTTQGFQVHVRDNRGNEMGEGLYVEMFGGEGFGWARIASAYTNADSVATFSVDMLWCGIFYVNGFPVPIATISYCPSLGMHVLNFQPWFIF